MNNNVTVYKVQAHKDQIEKHPDLKALGWKVVENRYHNSTADSQAKHNGLVSGNLRINDPSFGRGQMSALASAFDNIIYREYTSQDEAVKLYNDLRERKLTAIKNWIN